MQDELSLVYDMCVGLGLKDYCSCYMSLTNNTSKLSYKAESICIETDIKLDNVDTYLQNKAPNRCGTASKTKHTNKQKTLMVPLLCISVIAV